MKEKLIAQIKSFVPFNGQETADKALFLQLLESGDDLSLRENLSAHLTASAWVVTPDREMVLMAFHNLYNSWAWLGGHADGNWDLQAVAEKEAREESGLEILTPICDDPISLEILTVSGHEKRGRYVPGHLHLNLTYLFEADASAQLRIKPDENSGVGWIGCDDIKNRSTEPWFIDRIYSKLIKKAKLL